MGVMAQVLIAGLLVASTRAAEMRPEPEGPIVHLFEWRFDDIANECVDFLQNYGYGGVQVSPVNENIMLPGRPWYERYQPLSYKIGTRSGTEEEFAKMVKTCNHVGVKIYVDVVFNHMTGSVSHNDSGTAGSTADIKKYSYPAVPYTKQDFHEPCEVKNWNTAPETRLCEVLGLHDLDQTRPNVREAMIHYLNKLLEHGVAGFRVDAVKHMNPADLKAIFDGAENVSSKAGFVAEARPYVYQEYFGTAEGNINPKDYYESGAVTDFKYGMEVSKAFRNQKELKCFETFGGLQESWGLLQESKSLVFIDNHDTQRGQYGETILTYKNSRQYKMAVAFMLAWPFGQPLVTSSFDFKNVTHGPPANPDGSIQRIQFRGDNCTNGWICEHRWRQIYNMAVFRKVVGKAPVEKWWDNDKNQIAFSRGDKGFVLFNAESLGVHTRIKTTLPKGKYCDIVTGQKVNFTCTGRTVEVDDEGLAHIDFRGDHEDGFLAIHVKSKL